MSRIEMTRVEGRPRALTLLEVNARFMRPETFRALVANVRRDGTLTSEPLVYRHHGLEEFDELPNGTLEVLSGNHRVQAAIEADLSTIGWLEVERLPRQRRVALQLSHNAITGEDDPATLKRLYDSLQDVDERVYAGLDDKTLDLLEKVEVGSMSEANLDFLTVQLVFLPHELDEARAALEDAARAVRADERWLAHREQYEPLLDALQTAHSALNVGNVATALMGVLAVFEENLGSLQGAWLGPDGDPRHKGVAPLETIFGDRSMPVDAAAVVVQAVERMVGRGECDPHKKWQALERLAADYLAGP